MKINSLVLATISLIVLLAILLGWAFYQTLQMDSNDKNQSEKYPQKAVMAQAQSINEVRLEELAQRGKVVAGMTMEQVRLALGAPERSEQVKQNGENLTVWGYQHDGRGNIVFNSHGLVNKIEKQP